MVHSRPIAFELFLSLFSNQIKSFISDNTVPQRHIRTDRQIGLGVQSTLGTRHFCPNTYVWTRNTL